MRIDSWERRRGTNPVFFPSRALLLTAPPLLAPRCADKLSRLRRLSSLLSPASSSLVVPGGGRDERRTGRRRTGQVRAPFIFTDTSFHIPWFSLTCSQRRAFQKSPSFYNRRGGLAINSGGFLNKPGGL